MNGSLPKIATTANAKLIKTHCGSKELSKQAKVAMEMGMVVKIFFLVVFCCPLSNCSHQVNLSYLPLSEIVPKGAEKDAPFNQCIAYNVTIACTPLVMVKAWGERSGKTMETNNLMKRCAKITMLA